MGYVYILTNESYRYGLFRRKLIKIGKTERDPKDRAQELNTTGVPEPFEVVHRVFSHQSDELETEMHNRLKKYRSNTKREFFKYPVSKAIKLLNELKKKDFTPIEQSVPPNYPEVSKPEKLNDFTPELHKVSSNNSMPKLGINGKPYYSEENGFDKARNVDGMAVLIQDHVTIIIDNEELELQSSHEHLEAKIDELRNEINILEENKKEIEETIKADQDDIAETTRSLAALESIDEQQTTVHQKTEEFDKLQVKQSGLEAELKKFPPNEEDTPKRQQLRLYPLLCIFSIILSLALYFFYVSALDKGFFSSIDINALNTESLSSLNELFDPGAFFRAIEKKNIWLLLFPIFPLGLALVIHPFWSSMEKHWGAGQKIIAFFSGLAIFGFVCLTFVFDSIIALQVSKQIHTVKKLTQEDIGEWSISPRNPFTWDLNIILVLFCGFFVSVLLSVIFHFTIKLWQEARTQSADDRNSIEKKLSELETEMHVRQDELTHLSEALENSKQQMGEVLIDGILIKAQITGLKGDIQNRKDSVVKSDKQIANVQAKIVEKQKLIQKQQELQSKIFINVKKLRGQVSSFVTGWAKYLQAAKGDAAEMPTVKAQDVAHDTLKRYFQSRGVQWESE